MIKLTPNLTQAAWTKSKTLAQKFKSAIKIGSTNLTPLLKELEKAAKADDYALTLATLETIEETARKAQSNSSVDEESRDLLKAMVEDAKKLKPTLVAAIKKSDAKEDSKSDAKGDGKGDGKGGQKADPGTGKTVKQTIFSKSMVKDVQVSGLKHVKPPEFQFDVEMALDEGVFKSLKNDSIYLLEVNKGCQKVYDQTVASIVSKLKAFDKLIQTMIDKQAPQEQMKKQLDGLNKSFEEDKRIAIVACEQLAADLWVAFCRKKTEYLKYKIKIVATITGALASLATSIAIMASSPFTGGASAVLSIIGMAKSAVVLTKEISSAVIEVETCQTILAKQIGFVEAALKKGQASRTVNELAAAAFTEFFGVSQPCIKTCQSQADTMVQKLNGIEIKSHDLSKKLNGMLDAQETLKKDFLKEAATRLKKIPSETTKDHLKRIDNQLDDFLSSNYAAVIEGIDKTSKAYERYKKANTEAKALQKRMKALGDRTTLEKVFSGVLSLKDIPLGVLDGNAIASSANMVTNMVPPAATWTYDRVCEVALDGTFLEFKK